MGGTQSWLACDGTYPTPAPVPGQKQAAPGSPEDGNLLIAVIMFVVTVFLLLSLTCLGHCIAIARRKKPPTDQHAAALAASHHAASVQVLVEAGDEDLTASDMSSSDSEESDIDSVTARAMQLAASRRMSRSPAPAGGIGQQIGFDNRGFVH